MEVVFCGVWICLEHTDSHLCHREEGVHDCVTGSHRLPQGGGSRSPRALAHREHQVFVGRTGPHDIGLGGIGFGTPRVTCQHLGTRPDDHDV